MDNAAAAAAEDGGLVFSNATKALAMRWYRLAKDVLEEKFKAKSESLTKEMQKTLEQMPEEEDWYYGASTRMEGRDLLAKGEDLEVILLPSNSLVAITVISVSLTHSHTHICSLTG